MKNTISRYHVRWPDRAVLSDLHPLMIDRPVSGDWNYTLTHNECRCNPGTGNQIQQADSSSWYQVLFDPDKTTFLQIDIDPMEIGRNYPVEIGAMGDLKIGLGQILEEVKKLCRRVEIILNYVPESQRAKADFKQSNAAISSDSRSQ